MKSGGPWNLRGLRPDARATAHEAARRSGMSVGEWLNTVIQPANEDDGDRAADFDRELEDRSQRGSHNDKPTRYRHPGADHRRRERESDDEWRRSLHPDDRQSHGYREVNWQARDRSEDDDVPVRRQGGPYREGHRRSGGSHDEEQLYQEQSRERERIDRPRREQERHNERAAGPPESSHDAFVDQAVAEITARQRALEGNAAAEIAARQRALEGDAAELSLAQRQPLPSSSLPEGRSPTRKEPPRSGEPPASAPDLSGLEEHLRQITARIESLRPAKELETAIGALRADLAEIGRSLTEALPRRALDSLEIEIKALAQRIDHSRQSGVDTTALAGLERGLAEVREALRGLTPAESLVGFDEAVKGLAKKVDALAAKDDPAAMQQLETAIGALRGIVSHVASDGALTKVAEEVRALAAKIDGIASTAVSGPTLSLLEDRINTLAAAVKASTEAGHSVPRELEKLLAGLIEKLEWVQLTHTDHTALAHLEDRIATLVKRLDASDSRFGLLEGVERGLADLLVYIDQLRATKSDEEGVVRKPVAVESIEQEVARTQDSLEAVQGTVEHVVDRLAMIESDMRGDKMEAALAEPLPVNAQVAIASEAPAEPPEIPAAASVSSAASVVVEMPTQSEPAARRAVVARAPIDPSLPPDHPLEPGSAASRPRGGLSAALRIAASEAAVGSRPPVIPDSRGAKPDFIAAARRAAQAAAAGSPHTKSSADVAAGGQRRPTKASDRVRSLVVAAAVVAIVVGGFHIVSRLFEGAGSGAPSPERTESPPTQTEPPRMQTEPPRVQTETPSVPESPPIPAQPPRVQTEQPLPPAASGPAVKPADAPPTIPLPAADSAQHTSVTPPPSWLPDATTGAGPEKPTGSAISRGLAPWLAPAPDITGSLPPVPAARRPGTTPAQAVGGETLPAAIGNPSLRGAALAGDATAAYEVAVRFAEGRVVAPNNEEAARWFERAANKGLTPAQFRLGSLYEKGLGVKKNLPAARDLYRAAADKGHGKAMHNLAVLYAEGIDGAADYRTAAQWFRKAADRGISDSQYNLAVLYARGVGVEQNFAESYKWFFLAAKEGDKDAALKRDEVATYLDEEALAAARLAAQAWTPLPQPAEAITVKGAWDPPSNAAPATRPKPRPPIKISSPDAAKN
jgi:localization factor PodJL